MAAKTGLGCVRETDRQTDKWAEKRKREREQGKKIKVLEGRNIFQFEFSSLTFSCCLNKNYFHGSEESESQTYVIKHM